MDENEIIDQIREEREEEIAPEIIPTIVYLEDDLLESTDLQFIYLIYCLLEIQYDATNYNCIF